MNRAGKIGVRMGLVLALVLSGIMVRQATPVAAAEPVNEVHVTYQTEYNYNAPGDSFTNAQVTGDKHWSSAFQNNTQLPVENVTVTLTDGPQFEKVDPPTPGSPYEWYIGNVGEGMEHEKMVGVGYHEDPIDFTPGFDVSRSANQTVFTVSGTQVLTVTVRAQQALPRLGIDVRLWENENVSATITSVTADPTQDIYLDEDGQRVHIGIGNPVVGTAYTCEITTQVVLKPDVSQVEFMPRLSVITFGESIPSGTTSGSSLSHSVTEVGTWTWSTTGDYLWDWGEEILKIVHFEGYCRPLVNGAVTLFNTFWTYPSSGDTFSNTEVTGSQSWQAQILNSPDATGESITNTVLSLDSLLVFDWTIPDPVAPGPLYQWSFGDVAEGEVDRTAVGFTPDDITFTPGFDASRVVDKTIFMATENQTLTITVTPREESAGLLGMGFLFIDVLAGEDDRVIPVITSPSGADDAFLSPDGHCLLIVKENPVVGTEYTFTVTIQVTPKVAQVEFMPYVRVYTPAFDTAGPGSGNSVSYTVSEVGTWTWSATGDYEWMWLEGNARAVEFSGYSNNTPAGIDIDVVVDGNTITFSEVTVGGNTEVATVPEGPPIPTLYRLGKPEIYFEITTTSSYSAPVTICIDYSGIQYKNESQLQLWHWDGTKWGKIPTTVDDVNKLVYGVTDSLSIFTIVEPNLLPIALISTDDQYLAQVNSVFTFDGSASGDPDGTIQSYEWDFGDGNTGSGASVTHTYDSPSLYNVILTVTDDTGAQSTAAVLVVVYDPDAGFATGGGWIIPGKQGNSDPGDYLPNIDGESKATFGFVVKYQKGATEIPSGQLEFQYHVGNFNLHSADYEWLVVTNTNWAKFQGVATIAGFEGLYPFRVDCRDGDKDGGTQLDRFIIKIWAPGADPDVDDLLYKASGDLGGGQIKIHK